ncbi:hypothetical protein WA026_007828 [Henosepilachna vigintioctopunctata]|uniref:Uncharacterized protein n=1 Tax=Henosepilachna vigintioctopunctata TaxID=420089 RepID=A0AAW1TXH4_9CUCU
MICLNSPIFDSTMKYFFMIAFVCLAYIHSVASLKCYNCISNKACTQLENQTCGVDEKYCVSAIYEKIHFKRCAEIPNYCQLKDSEGKGFTQCKICQTDFCNC